MAQEKINMTAGQTARVENHQVSIGHDILFPTGDFTPFTLYSFFWYSQNPAPHPLGTGNTTTAMFDLTATN